MPEADDKKSHGKHSLFSGSPLQEEATSPKPDISPDQNRENSHIDKARLDPKGKAALFEAPVQAPDDLLKAGRVVKGKDALFSNDKRRPGTVIVECKDCKVRTRMSLIELGVSRFPLSAWLPTKRFGHWMRCPDCQNQTWCRIGWNE